MDETLAEWRPSVREESKKTEDRIPTLLPRSLDPVVYFSFSPCS